MHSSPLCVVHTQSLHTFILLAHGASVEPTCISRLGTWGVQRAHTLGGSSEGTGIQVGRKQGTTYDAIVKTLKFLLDLSSIPKFERHNKADVCGLLEYLIHQGDDCVWAPDAPPRTQRRQMPQRPHW